jgi:hypothetical protein
MFDNSIMGVNLAGWYGNPTYGITDAPPPDPNKPPLEIDAQGFLAGVQPPRMDGPNSVASVLSLATDLAGKASAAAATGASFVPIMIAGGLYAWSGNNFEYIPPAFGNYNTYRLIGKQPTVYQASGLFVDPIISATVSVEKREGEDVPDDWVDLVKRQVLPNISMVVEACAVGRFQGWQPFEKCWTINDDGEYVCMLRPMLVDYSRPYISRETGMFTGMAYGSSENILPPNKCISITHKPYLGIFGDAAYDVLYEPFNAWHRARMDQRKLRDKLSGILPILYFPPGKQPDGRDNRDIAMEILRHVGRGGAVSMPSAQFDPALIAREPRLAAASLWNLTFYDAGTLAPAQTGLIDELQYNDALFFRGIGLPERSGQAGKKGGGTNADAETQSENAVLSIENWAASIAVQLSGGNPFFGVPGWVDDILRYNVGPKAVGKVILKFQPLADAKLRLKADLFGKAMTPATPTPATTAFMNAIDVDKTLADFGFDKSEDGYDAEGFNKDVEDTKNKSTGQTDPNDLPTPTPPPGGKPQPGKDPTKPTKPKRAPWVKKFLRGG